MFRKRKKRRERRREKKGAPRGSKVVARILRGHLHYTSIKERYCVLLSTNAAYQRDRDAVISDFSERSFRAKKNNVPAPRALPNIIFKSDFCMQFDALGIYIINFCLRLY